MFVFHITYHTLYVFTRRRRKGKADTSCTEPTKYQIEYLQTRQHHNGSRYGNQIHSRTARHTDSCRNPQACSRGKSAYYVLLENDDTRTDETDTCHYLRSYSRGVERYVCIATSKYFAKTRMREYHKECTTKSHK